MTDPDAVALLDALLEHGPADVFDCDGPAAQADLRRILEEPALQPPHRRPVRRLRRLGIVAVAVAVVGAALALWPSIDRSPDVVARAAAALNQPDTILHFTAHVRDRDSPDELRAGAPNGHVDQTVEMWQTAGARQQHAIINGADEYVEDWDTRTALGYIAQRNELIRNRDPRIFDPAYRIAHGSDEVLGRMNIPDDLARLPQRARDHDDSVHLLGQTTIRGIAVYELRIDYTQKSVIVPTDTRVTDPAGLPATPVELSHLVYVDRDSYLPVRIVDMGPGARVSAITDYSATERLDRTPESERLLRMSPHPAAKQVTAGTP